MRKRFLDAGWPELNYEKTDYREGNEGSTTPRAVTYLPEPDEDDLDEYGDDLIDPDEDEDAETN